MVKIRKATLADLNLVIKLYEDIYFNDPDYDSDVIIDFAASKHGKKYFKREIINNKGCFLIAEDNKKAIGYTNGSEISIPYLKSKYFEIDNLGVIPKYKKKGVGKILLSEITKYAKLKGYKKIFLTCYIKNHSAIEFFKSKGFSEIDITLQKEI